MKPTTKPLRKKLRQFKPMSFYVTGKELEKLPDAKITVPLKFYTWVTNLVLVRKNNDKIRLCVDFWNLKRN